MEGWNESGNDLDGQHLRNENKKGPSKIVAKIVQIKNL